MLRAMYNEFAETYCIADQFGAISKSHRVAIEQIRSLQMEHASEYRILDLGVGDGTFLKKLQDIIPHPNPIWTGIDVSEEMLKRAQEHLEIKTIEANVEEADQYLPPHSQDLVLAHFINAYLPIQALLASANRLTRANGHFSMITTTYDSFTVAQGYLAQFISEGSLLGNVVGHYYKSIIKNTTVATNEQTLLDAFVEHGFKVVAHERLYIPIELHSIEDLTLFGLEGTWFLNSLSIRLLPRHFLIERVKRLFGKIFTFPYRDTHIIDVILAKK